MKVSLAARLLQQFNPNGALAITVDGATSASTPIIVNP
ncbi:hypothetical protein COLO4_32244 [Corchorus olitorius]|uniref:Uncharacterized protein n=1 Tax=Corchorus olitorius TaxID=93759 RepID=A0A1R3H072_9ROSI|nr:hypothetical protein COLO4_32244 [Corchorus olitorius]